MNPNPPAYSMAPSMDAYADEQLRPKRWSALAITAFVLSLIGFFGVTAILGVILGIAGIAVTRGGRRRGMGLAVAAIPISLVTGALGAVVVYGGFTFLQMYKTSEKLVPILSASTDKSAEGATELLALGSKSFREDIDQDRLERWLKDVQSKHGNLAEFAPDQNAPPITPNAAGNIVLNMRGKFTNGAALMRITFVNDSLLNPRIDDLEVDGVSPRTAPRDATRE